MNIDIHDERVHINVDTHQYRIHPIAKETAAGLGHMDSAIRLITYKGITYEYLHGYMQQEVLEALEFEGDKLKTAKERRSYMMIAVIAVLASRGLINISPNNTTKETYHKFSLTWAIAVEFSFLVKTNQVIFKSLRLSNCTLTYDDALKVANFSHIIMNNLQDIITEINDVYNNFKPFSENETKIDTEDN
jgi:hypothetical protein